MPADPGVLIVGAGAAGLALAAELAPHGPVTVADRLPTIGGVLGGEHPAIRTLGAAAPGVTWLLATTVLRWRGDAALVAGPDGIRWLPARRLVYAGGSRPATRAELGIAGARPAGVLSAPVALPLLEAGVLLGNRVAVLGGGHWARAVGALLASQPCATIAVTAAGAPAFDGAGEHLAGRRATAVDGVARVTAVLLAPEAGAPELRIPCDAVVLAAPSRPVRNVDGAVLPGSAGVTFVQPDGADVSVDAVVATARAAAAELLAPPTSRSRSPTSGDCSPA